MCKHCEKCKEEEKNLNEVKKDLSETEKEKYGKNNDDGWGESSDPLWVYKRSNVD